MTLRWKGVFCISETNPNLACPCIYWTIPTKNLATPSPSPHANPHLKPWMDSNTNWWMPMHSNPPQPSSPFHVNVYFQGSKTARPWSHKSIKFPLHLATYLALISTYRGWTYSHPKRTLVDLAPISNCCLVISRNIQFSHKIPIRTVGCWLPKNDQIYQIIGKAISYDPIWNIHYFPISWVCLKSMRTKKTTIPTKIHGLEPHFPQNQRSISYS